MRTQTRSESLRHSKSHPAAATKTPKKKAASKSASVAKHRGHSKSETVSHENDLFDEEEDFESPRRNPSQARPSEFHDVKKRK